MVVKSLKSLIVLFFKTVLFFCICTDPLYQYRCPVFVLIFCIGTGLLCSYWSPVSVLFYCILIYDSDICCAYYLTCYYLTLDSCMLSPDIYCSLILLLWIVRVVCTQLMETWGIWYIYKAFLIWIIHLRYQSHESIYWARKTGFITSLHLITWCLFHVQVCMLTIRFSTLDSDLSIHVCLSLNATWHSSHHSLGSFWLP